MTSFQLMQVLIAVERAFAVELPDSALRLETFESAGSIAAVVDSLTSEAGHMTSSGDTGIHLPDIRVALGQTCRSTSCTTLTSWPTARHFAMPEPPVRRCRTNRLW